MLYIKLDEDNNPVNHPVLEDNLKDVLEVSHIDDDVLKNAGYARFERFKEPANAVVVQSTDYYMDTDGIVRNRATVREFTQEEMIDKFIRSRRSYLLVACDWTQTVDSPLSAQKKQEWADYRQALRDLTINPPTINSEADVIWPIEPQKGNT
jgi:hypothetical protein